MSNKLQLQIQKENQYQKQRQSYSPSIEKMQKYPSQIGCASQDFSQQFYDCIGMLKSVWRNKITNRPQYMDYGTAFSVSPHLIITCTHNIYHQDNQSIADQVIFIPNHHGYILPNTQIYQSISKKEIIGQQQYLEQSYCEFIRLNKGKTLTEKPTINELCLIVLSKPINAKKFLQIGQLQPEPGKVIQIIGYPSKQYAKTNNLLSIDLTRKHLMGKITSIDIEGSIINHDLNTQIGHSGSPILCLNKRNQIVVIGIHTHRDNAHASSGLFFNQLVVLKLKKFQQNLLKRFHLSDSNHINYQGKQIITQKQFYNYFQQMMTKYYSFIEIIKDQRGLKFMIKVQ